MRCSTAPNASSAPAIAQPDPQWIPALDGVDAKLERGAKVADVGCGHGASTIIMAQAFPNSTFFGFDYHDAVDRAAREAAAEAGVADRVAFEVAAAQGLPGRRLRPGRLLRLPARHGRPGRRGGARRDTLAPDGTWLIVEPFANDPSRTI